MRSKSDEEVKPKDALDIGIAARELYYCAFDLVASQHGLRINRHDYGTVVIEKPRRFLRGNMLVAIVESDAPIAGIPDNYNGNNVHERRYEGLEISLLRPEYKNRVEWIKNVMKQVFEAQD